MQTADEMTEEIPDSAAGENEEAPEEKIVQGVHNYSAAEGYVRPTDPKVLEKLEWFQDQKLALMMHWGPYSQLGVVESWALSDADAGWSRTGIDWEADGRSFKEQYFGLNKTFNPIRFDPEKWAETAAEAGIRYLVFTTKHHDGFCMWDSKYSDYKITGEDCPFHTHRYADICGHLFEAFRKRGWGLPPIFQGGLAYGQLLGEGVSKRGIYVERTFLCSGGASGGMGTFCGLYPEPDPGAGSKLWKAGYHVV